MTAADIGTAVAVVTTGDIATGSSVCAPKRLAPAAAANSAPVRKARRVEDNALHLFRAIIRAPGRKVMRRKKGSCLTIARQIYQHIQI